MFLENAIAELELTEKQMELVTEIRDEFHKKMREMFDKMRDGKLERQEANEASRVNHEELMKDMKDVLTDAQFKRFREMMPPRPQHLRLHPRPAQQRSA